MKIVICCSMSAVEKAVAVSEELEKIGYQVVLPENVQRHLEKLFDSKESTQEKIKDDLIRKYFEKIKESDAVLVINEEKKGIAGYIGGNTFLEMGFAHVLGKKIFLLNPIPNMAYTDEIFAMQPVVLNCDLSLIN